MATIKESVNAYISLIKLGAVTVSCNDQPISNANPALCGWGLKIDLGKIINDHHRGVVCLEGVKYAGIIDVISREGVEIIHEALKQKCQSIVRILGYPGGNFVFTNSEHQSWFLANKVSITEAIIFIANYDLSAK